VRAKRARWHCCCYCGESGQNLGMSGGDPPNPPAAGEVAHVLGRHVRSAAHMC
jgi:hypothetical protein